MIRSKLATFGCIQSRSTCAGSGTHEKPHDAMGIEMCTMIYANVQVRLRSQVAQLEIRYITLSLNTGFK